MFERIQRGWELTKSSYRCLMRDKEMLVFPLVSGVACIAVLASFALPLIDSDYLATALEEENLSDPLAYVLLFLFYLANYFVIIFFNSALIACAIIRFRGSDPTLVDGFRAALARLPQIFLWALVSATVGTILRVLESRSGRVGEFVAGLLGMAWSAVGYFVVPVIVAEKSGPFEALNRSVSILRKSWGEALTANFGTTLLIFVMALAAAIPGLVIGVISPLAGLVVTAVLWIFLALMSSALNGITRGAVYLYAADSTTPSQFDGELLREAFARK